VFAAAGADDEEGAGKRSGRRSGGHGAETSRTGFSGNAKNGVIFIQVGRTSPDKVC
jgi:hypothetical protein